MNRIPSYIPVFVKGQEKKAPVALVPFGPWRPGAFVRVYDSGKLEIYEVLSIGASSDGRFSLLVSNPNPVKVKKILIHTKNDSGKWVSGYKPKGKKK